MEAVVGCLEPGCCWGRTCGRGGGRRSCTRPSIPGGLGNQSCALKKLAVAGPPTAGGGPAHARRGDCQRSAGRQGGCWRELAPPLLPELGGSKCVDVPQCTKMFTRIRCCGARWDGTGIAKNRASRIACFFIFQHICNFVAHFACFGIYFTASNAHRRRRAPATPPSSPPSTWASNGADRGAQGVDCGRQYDTLLPSSLGQPATPTPAPTRKTWKRRISGCAKKSADQ